MPTLARFGRVYARLETRSREIAAVARVTRYGISLRLHPAARADHDFLFGSDLPWSAAAMDDGRGCFAAAARPSGPILNYS
jgi:hypothetical protein